MQGVHLLPEGILSYHIVYWENIGMRSMQGLIFGWMGWDGTDFAFNVFISVTEKSITFKNENIAERQKKNLIYLNSHRYYVIYCLYFLNTSKLKWNASVPRLLLSPSQPLVGLVIHSPLFTGCVTRSNNRCEKDYAYCHSSNREKIKIIRLQVVTSKI